MYLHKLMLWNFRKYGIKGDAFETAKPGLEITFNKGLNVLVGENDSGKTAIIDSIRLVLLTQSQEYLRIEEEDFHQPQGGQRSSHLKIECTFKGFTDAEAGNFLEWAGFENDEDGKPEYVLSVRLTARRKDNRIIPDVKAGQDDEGTQMDGNARDLLRVTYLKPLRDADAELTPGRRSRLSQILSNHRVFQKKNPAEKHKLEECVEEANRQIRAFFDAEKQPGAPVTESGKEIVDGINGFIEKFFDPESKKNAYVGLSKVELADILRRLSLSLEENKSGLGSLNLLFIATELLLLQRMESSESGLRLALIEELEAHLHVQAQLRLIKYLEEETSIHGGQFILTTHSTILSSEISLSSLVICQNDAVYPMSAENTELQTENYEFLERFLDATKANLFFAKGVIFVEGDAENLLLPAVADIMDRPLHRHGVSIVNVGSKAFLSYARIFARKADPRMSIPVAVITDLDVPPFEHNEGPKKVLQLTAANIENINGKATFSQVILGPAKDKVFRSRSAILRAIRKENAGRLPNGLAAEIESLGRDLAETDIPVLRAQAREKVLQEYDKDKVKAFIAGSWTLEYDLAMSALNKELHAAIIQADDPDMTKEEVAEKVEIDFNSWNGKTADEIAYEIYSPLLKGNVSKAVAAQYFAKVLREKCKEPTEKIRIALVINTDPHWKYLRDAIAYTTRTA